MLRDLGIHGVIWLRTTELRTTEERLEEDEQERQADLRGPLISEDVDGNCTGDGGDVWVVNLGDELHFGYCKGIAAWEHDVLQRRDQATVPL